MKLRTSNSGRSRLAKPAERGNLTSDRQRRANGANARASTGPKTRAGKARSAKNALRHGLNITVWSDLALAPRAEAIALTIAGSNADAEILLCASDW